MLIFNAIPPPRSVFVLSTDLVDWPCPAAEMRSEGTLKTAAPRGVPSTRLPVVSARTAVMSLQLFAEWSECVFAGQGGSALSCTERHACTAAGAVEECQERSARRDLSSATLKA